MEAHERKRQRQEGREEGEGETDAATAPTQLRLKMVPWESKSGKLHFTSQQWARHHCPLGLEEAAVG